jgi:hypothetical protein
MLENKCHGGSWILQPNVKLKLEAAIRVGIEEKLFGLALMVPPLPPELERR